MIDLDDALSQTKMTLRAEAARVADTEGALVSMRSGHVSELRRPSSRGRFLVLAAASIMVIAGLVAVAWVKSDDDDEPAGPDPSIVTVPPTLTVPQTAAPTVPSTITTPGTVAPPGTTQPIPVWVGSIVDSFFVDPDHGWLTESANDGSFQTSQTSDGGATWTPVASMPDGVTKAHFAPDVTNGWAFNDTSLWSTHDGGTTWNEFSPTGGQFGGPQAVAVVGDQVYVAVADDDGVQLDYTAVTTDDLTSTGIRFAYGAGPVMDISLVTQPDGVWMIYNDRTVVGSARIIGGVMYPAWRPPAAAEGGDVHMFGDPSGGPVYVLANTGVWTSDEPLTKLFVSDDQGTSFRQLTPPTGAGAGPNSFVVGTAGPGAIYLSDGTTAVRSTDEGVTWTAAPGLETVASPTFVTPTVAFAVVDSDGRQELRRTDDAGATWRPIAIAEAP